MSDEQLTRIAGLFEEALALPARDRPDFLRQNARDAAERSELQRLLKSDCAARNFLERPALDRLGEVALTDVLAAEPGVAGEPLTRIGRYAIEGPLGRGSMGEVYLARQDQTDQLVALKVLRTTWVGRKAVRRFDREMRILGRLQHPGIARILEAGRADFGSSEQSYFAMEYVQGRDLLDHVREHGLNLRQRVRLVVDMCEAADHAHEQGVIHRDLKPDNVLVTGEGQVKILDFGVARVTDPELQLTTQRTSEVQIIGTIAYMSPEQAAGDVRRLDRRSDVYSLGIVVYELLAGRRPVDLGEHTVLEAARAIQEKEPPWLSSVAEQVPRDLAIVVHKALAKEPERRYRSAAAMAADLTRWLNHEPITARPASTFYTLRKLARRHWGLTVGLTCTILVLSTAVIVSAILTDRAVKATADARWSSYLANLAAAAADVQGGSFSRAQRRLADSPVQHRGFEWRYLQNLADPSTHVLRGHNSGFGSAATTADGLRVWSADISSGLRSWDLRTGEPLRELGGHGDNSVMAVATSRDGTRLASGDEDGIVYLHDARSLASIATLRDHKGGCTSLAFSPDSKELASGSGEGVVRLWDARTGALVRTLLNHAGRVDRLVFSPDGSGLATSARDGTVKIFDSATGSEVQRFESFVASWYSAPLAYTPDGSLLAVGGPGEHVEIRRVADGELVGRLAADEENWPTLVFAPDGRHLVTGSSENTIAVWDVSSLERVTTLVGHAAMVLWLEYTPDGRHLVSGAQDRTLRVWEVDLWETAGLLGASEGDWSLGPEPETLVRSFSGGGTVEILELPSGERLASLPSAPGFPLVEIGRRGGCIVYADGAPKGRQYRGVELASGQTLFDWTGDAAMDINSHGKLVALSTIQHEVVLLDVDSGELRQTLPGHEDYVRALDFSPDGRVLASAGDDPVIRLWDVESGELLTTLEGHEFWGIHDVEFGPEGRFLASGGNNRKAHVYDLKSHELVATVDTAAPVTSVAFNPETSRLVTGGKDGAVRLWSLDTLEELLALHPRGSAPIVKLFFSRDASFLFGRTDEAELFVLDGR